MSANWELSHIIPWLLPQLETNSNVSFSIVCDFLVVKINIAYIELITLKFQEFHRQFPDVLAVQKDVTKDIWNLNKLP